MRERERERGGRERDEREREKNLEVRPKKRKTLNLFFFKKNSILLSRAQQMMKLQRGFPDFDLDGKEIYLDKVRGDIS